MTSRAADILAAHWDGQLPVDLNRIADGLGVVVAADDQLDGLSGTIQMNGGRPHVTYNPAEPLVRQRFTIAHELGHLALGHLRDGERLLRDPAANFSSGTLPPMEREANTFAADLLMPEKVVAFAVNERRILDIGVLAKLFGVSQVAMRYRVQHLGLLGG